MENNSGETEHAVIHQTVCAKSRKRLLSGPRIGHPLPPPTPPLGGTSGCAKYRSPSDRPLPGRSSGSAASFVSSRGSARVMCEFEEVASIGGRRYLACPVPDDPSGCSDPKSTRL